MYGAQYFRAQAELCLKIARQLSDSEAAENLYAKAAQYLARASEAEGSAATSSQSIPTAEASGDR
jgi:hypothetical protein